MAACAKDHRTCLRLVALDIVFNLFFDFIFFCIEYFSLFYLKIHMQTCTCMSSLYEIILNDHIKMLCYAYGSNSISVKKS